MSNLVSAGMNDGLDMLQYPNQLSLAIPHRRFWPRPRRLFFACLFVH